MTLAEQFQAAFNSRRKLRYSRDAMIVYRALQERLRYDKRDPDGERWITINGNSGDDGDGGTPVKIDGKGNITGGPKGLADKGIKKLDDFGKKQPAKQTEPPKAQDKGGKKAPTKPPAKKDAAQKPTDDRVGPANNPHISRALAAVGGGEDYANHYGKSFQKFFDKFDSLSESEKAREYRSNEGDGGAKELQTELGAKVSYAGRMIGLTQDGMKAMNRALKSAGYSIDGKEPQEPAPTDEPTINIADLESQFGDDDPEPLPETGRKNQAMRAPQMPWTAPSSRPGQAPDPNDTIQLASDDDDDTPPPTPPKPAPRQAAVAAPAPQRTKSIHDTPAGRDFDQAFAAVDAKSGGRNFVKIADLRKALPQYSPEEFNAALRQLRMDDHFSADSAQGGYVNLSDEDRAGGIEEGSSNLVYLTRKGKAGGPAAAASTEVAGMSELTSMGNAGSGDEDAIKRRLNARGKVLDELRKGAEAQGTTDRMALVDMREKLIADNRRDIAALSGNAAASRPDLTPPEPKAASKPGYQYGPDWHEITPESAPYHQERAASLAQSVANSMYNLKTGTPTSSDTPEAIRKRMDTIDQINKALGDAGHAGHRYDRAAFESRLGETGKTGPQMAPYIPPTRGEQSIGVLGGGGSAKQASEPAPPIPLAQLRREHKASIDNLDADFDALTKEMGRRKARARTAIQKQQLDAEWAAEKEKVSQRKASLHSRFQEAIKSHPEWIAERKATSEKASALREESSRRETEAAAAQEQSYLNAIASSGGFDKVQADLEAQIRDIQGRIKRTSEANRWKLQSALENRQKDLATLSELRSRHGSKSKYSRRHAPTLAGQFQAAFRSRGWGGERLKYSAEWHEDQHPRSGDGRFAETAGEKTVEKKNKQGPAAKDGRGMSPRKFTVKPPKKLFRAVGDTGGTGVASLGKGIYSSPSRQYAKKYGNTILEMTADEAFPSNPLVLPPGGGHASDALIDWLLKESGERNMRAFNAKHDIAGFVQSKGFDGVWIGDEIVYYPNK